MQNAENQRFCGGCGSALIAPTPADNDAVIQAAYNYAPLIKVLQWMVGACGFAIILFLVICASALLGASESSVTIWMGVLFWLTVLAGVPLTVLYWVRVWQNATMLQISHPKVCRKLKGVFWTTLIRLPFLVFIAITLLGLLTGVLATTGGFAGTVVGMFLMLMVPIGYVVVVVHLCNHRDKLIAGNSPSRVTVWYLWYFGLANVISIGVEVLRRMGS